MLCKLTGGPFRDISVRFDHSYRCLIRDDLQTKPPCHPELINAALTLFRNTTSTTFRNQTTRSSVVEREIADDEKQLIDKIVDESKPQLEALLETQLEEKRTLQWKVWYTTRRV